MSKRLTYIYWAVPLFTLLGCGSTLVSLLPLMAGVAVGALLALLTWGVVWMRLYANQRLRPEFSILAVLPHLCFFGLVAAGETGAEGAFASSAWQNTYFLLFLASMAVQLFSLRPGPGEPRKKASQDSVFVLLGILVLVYGFFTWMSFAPILFPIT